MFYLIIGYLLSVTISYFITRACVKMQGYVDTININCMMVPFLNVILVTVILINLMIDKNDKLLRKLFGLK